MGGVQLISIDLRARSGSLREKLSLNVALITFCYGTVISELPKGGQGGAGIKSRGLSNTWCQSNGQRKVT